MRPTYERAHNLSDEDRVAFDLSRRWGVEVKKTAKYLPYDRAVVNDGTVKCLFEVKCRGASYPTYWIGLEKWRQLVSISEAVAVPCLLVVRWPEGKEIVTRYVKVAKGPRDLVWGGRTDRGDPADEEVCVVIKIDEMPIIDC